MSARVFGVLSLVLLFAACIDESALGIPDKPSEDAGATGAEGDDNDGATSVVGDADGTQPDGTASDGASDDGGISGTPPDSAAALYAQARCAAWSRCPCPMMPFADVAACEASTESLFIGAQEQFSGATTDFECFGAIVDFYDASTCETTLQLKEQRLAPTCALFSDDDALDAPCLRLSNTAVRADSCAEGLSCVLTVDGRVCRPEGDSEHVKLEGETCVRRAGFPGPCTSGTWCDHAGTQTCRPRVRDGQVCTANAGCQSGYCVLLGDSGLCTEKSAASSACTSTASCASPVCSDSGCERPLCADGTCQQGVPQVCFNEDL